MAVVPLLAVGAALFFLPDERRPRYRDHITTTTIWNQVNTGPYGPRPGISYDVVVHIFPKQYVDSHDAIKRSLSYVETGGLPPNFTVPLNVVEDLWTYHPYINWRQNDYRGLRKALQLYKYGYVFKDVVHLTNVIMAQAIIGNTDKWFTLYDLYPPSPFGSKDFSYSNYPISYSEDDLGRNPAPSMIDPTKSMHKEVFR